MATFDDFDKAERKIARLQRTAIFLSFMKGLCVAVFYICLIVIAVKLINQPELIGEFFGKIVSGFESAKAKVE